MEKKTVQNKSEKTKVENKAKTTTKKTDWSKVGESVSIIGLKGKSLEEGKEYKVTKEIAKILVEKKAAKLK